MSSLLISQTKRFVTSQANAGTTGLALLSRTIDHMFEHGDSTPLAWLLSKMEGRDANLLRAITGKVTGGISLSTTSKEAKAQPSGMLIKVSDNAGPSEAMDTLRDLVQAGESFRGKAVASELLGKEASVYDLHKAATRFMARAIKQTSMSDVMKELATVAQTLKDTSKIETIKPKKT